MPGNSRESRFSIAGFFEGLRQDPDPKETVGDLGVGIYGGYIQENEENSRLAGTNRYRTYSDIVANTTIVAAGVRYFMNLVSKAEWTVIESDPNSPESVAAAELMDEIMSDMRRPWHRVVRRAAGYRLYGFSVQEMTAKMREDGRVGVLDIAPRPQATIEKWDVAQDQEILGCVQRSPQDGAELYIPRSKFIYIVDDALNDSPEGLGLFRHIVNTNDRLRRYQDLEGYGFETDLRGIPIGRAPLSHIQRKVDSGELTEAQAGEILNPLRGFLKKAIRTPRLAFLMDSMPWFGEGETRTASTTRQFDLELLKGSNTSADAVNRAIERLQLEIARVLGVEFLLLGNSGSQALSRDKSHNFGLLVESALDEIRETFEKDLIPFVMKLNGVSRENWPKLKTETVQYRDVETIVDGLASLSRADLHPRDPAINEVREVLGLSPQPKDIVDLLLNEASGAGPALTNPELPTMPDDVINLPPTPGDEE